MTNLTLVIDDQLLQAARIKALQEGTSVNEICRQAIARYAQPADDGDAFMVQIRAMARRVKPAADGQPVWQGREALYDEMLAHRMYGRLPDVDAPAPGADSQPQKPATRRARK